MSMCVNSIPGVKLKVGQALPVSFSVVSFSRPNHSLWDALQLSFSLRSSPFLVVLGSSGSSWFYNNQRAGAGRSGSLYINTALVCMHIAHCQYHICAFCEQFRLKSGLQRVLPGSTLAVIGLEFMRNLVWWREILRKVILWWADQGGGGGTYPYCQ